MNTRELRVGNWVISYDNIDREPVFAYITDVGEGWASVALGDSCEAHDDIFEPIELSSEILTGCGFKSKHVDDPQAFFDRSTLCYYIDDFKLHRQGDDGVFMYYTYDSEVAVEYLHQLQNLYFAINGDELNIEL